MQPDQILASITDPYEPRERAYNAFGDRDYAECVQTVLSRNVSALSAYNSLYRLPHGIHALHLLAEHGWVAGMDYVINAITASAPDDRELRWCTLNARVYDRERLTPLMIAARE